MKKKRMITPIAAGLVALLALGPAAAQGGSLLSGYGGPGQGNQAILGSALLNGPPSGGGGGSSGGGAPSSNTGNLAAPTTPATPPRSTASRRHVGRSRAGKHGARGATGSKATTGARSVESGAASAYNVSARGGSSHPVLGLSSDDVLYIVLALGVLVFTGVLTRRLADRQPASRNGGSRAAAQTPTSS
jgi:hypothetical protein